MYKDSASTSSSLGRAARSGRINRRLTTRVLNNNAGQVITKLWEYYLPEVRQWHRHGSSGKSRLESRSGSSEQSD